MKSKTSFFSKTLFIKNIKRYWPVWIVASIIALLVPVYVAMNMSYGEVYGKEAMLLEIKELYFKLIATGIPIISMSFAIMVAVCVWNYLYFAKSAGGLHSYPLSRKCLFVTNYLSGLAMMLIPYMAGCIALIIMFMAKGAGIPECTGTLILSIFSTSIFYFSAATIVAHITSHILALPVLYGVFMALEPIVVSLVGGVSSGFLYGVEYNYWHKLDFLCPIFYMLRKVGCIIDYGNPCVYNGEICQIYESRLEGFAVQLIYGAVGIVIAIGSYHIYQRRKNETAGDVIAVKVLKPIIITILTFVSTLSGTLILYLIFCDDYDDMRFIPYVLCLLVAATISYYVTNMVVEKKANVFNKRTNIGFAVWLSVCIAFGALLSVDVFNVEKYIPKKVESASIRIGNNIFNFVAGEDDEDIEKLKKLHAVLSQGEENNEIQTSETYFERRSIFTDLRYNVKDDTIERSYCPAYTENYLTESTKALYEFVSDPEILLQLFHVDDEFSLEYLNLDIYQGEFFENYNLHEGEYKQIYEALLKDVREGNWNPLDSDLYGNDGEVRVELGYGIWERDKFGSNFRNGDWVNIYLTGRMTNTLEAISEYTGLSLERLNEIMEWVAPEDENGHYDPYYFDKVGYGYID